MLRLRAPYGKAWQSLPPRRGFLWAVLWVFLRAVLRGARLSPAPTVEPAVLASPQISGTRSEPPLPEDQANHLAGLIR
jgi:hypothetical protein